MRVLIAQTGANVKITPTYAGLLTGEQYDIPERNILMSPPASPRWATRDEMYRLGAYVADHVNRASGPKAVAIPMKSLDNYSCEGN